MGVEHEDVKLLAYRGCVAKIREGVIRMVWGCLVDMYPTSLGDLIYLGAV